MASSKPPAVASSAPVPAASAAAGAAASAAPQSVSAAAAADSVRCEVHKDAVVCADAKILGLGSVKIGEGTVVHPACTIHAKVGPIVIGAFNVIEEQVEIVNASEEPLVIGDHNTFEVGTKVLGGGTKIGSANLFECKAEIGLGASIGDGCTVAVGARVPDREVLPDELVFVSRPGMRHVERGAREGHISVVIKHVEVLRDALPRCHHLRKPKA